MKKLAFIASILILSAAIYGYYLYNKPVASVSNQTAALTLNAKELLAAFETDEEAANSAYLDKLILVKGKVSKIAEGEKNHSIYLETSNMMSSIICELESGVNHNLKPGDNTSIKGICSGYLMDVVLVRSVIE